MRQGFHLPGAIFPRISAPFLSLLKKRFPERLSWLVRTGIQIAGFLFDPFGSPYQFVPVSESNGRPLRLQSSVYGLAYWVSEDGQSAVLAVIGKSPAAKDIEPPLMTGPEMVDAAGLGGQPLEKVWILRAEEIQSETTFPPGDITIETEAGGALRVSDRAGVLRVTLSGVDIDWAGTPFGPVILIPSNEPIQIRISFTPDATQVPEWTYIYFGDGEGSFVAADAMTHKYSGRGQYPLVVVGRSSAEISTLELRLAEIIKPDSMPLEKPPQRKPPATGIAELDAILAEAEKSFQFEVGSS
jgi:hypothetical protein